MRKESINEGNNNIILFNFIEVIKKRIKEIDESQQALLFKKQTEYIINPKEELKYEIKDYIALRNIIDKIAKEILLNLADNETINDIFNDRTLKRDFLQFILMQSNCNFDYKKYYFENNFIHFLTRRLEDEKDIIVMEMMLKIILLFTQNFNLSEQQNLKEEIRKNALRTSLKMRTFYYYYNLINGAIKLWEKKEKVKAPDSDVSMASKRKEKYESNSKSFTLINEENSEEDKEGRKLRIKGKKKNLIIKKEEEEDDKDNEEDEEKDEDEKNKKNKKENKWKENKPEQSDDDEEEEIVKGEIKRKKEKKRKNNFLSFSLEKEEEKERKIKKEKDNDYNDEYNNKIKTKKAKKSNKNDEQEEDEKDDDEEYEDDEDEDNDNRYNNKIKNGKKKKSNKDEDEEEESQEIEENKMREKNAKKQKNVKYKKEKYEEEEIKENKKPKGKEKNRKIKRNEIKDLVGLGGKSSQKKKNKKWEEEIKK